MAKEKDNNRPAVVKQLKALIEGGQAHATFDNAVEGLSAKLLGEKPHGLPYSIWQLAEHMRIVQWDILEFSRDPKHKSPSWPDEYWPKDPEPPGEEAWEDTLKKIKHDRKAFITLLEDDNNDLYSPFEWGDGQNLLREALLMADHNAYHTAEIIVLRRLLKAWKS